MRIMSFLLGAIGILILNTSLFASSFCACCVDRGYYYSGRERPDAYMLGMLDEMKFAPTSELYMTSAGYDGIKGLEGLEKEILDDSDIKFNLIETFLKRTWTISFTVPSGKKGSLTLPIPKYLTKYKIDTRDEESADRGLGVSLYKELKFVGTVGRASGMFRSASNATTYTLLFQGSGNGCDSSSDFKYWRLELRGPKTRYTLLGNLVVEGT